MNQLHYEDLGISLVGHALPAAQSYITSKTGVVVQEYLKIVSQEEDLPDTWQKSTRRHHVHKIEGLYEAVCDLEKVAANTLIDAASKGALKPPALGNLLYSLSQPLESVPYPFQECCLRHVHQELEFLASHDVENVLFIGGGAFPTTGINAALRGFSVTLVDYDGEANKIASALCSFLPEEVQRRISFVTANALELKLAPASYEAIFVAGMVSPKDAVIAHLAPQIVRDDRETYILSRSARSPVAFQLFNEDPEDWVQSSFHIGTICFNQLCDNRCRVYLASGLKASNPQASSTV